MGPWLLAVLNLVFALLCVALVFRLQARIASRWKRGLLWLIPVGLLLFFVALAGWDLYIYLTSNSSLGLRQHLIIGFLLIGYLIGVVMLRRRGRREHIHEESREALPANQHGSSAKLAWMALLLLAVQCLLWWSLDALAQQRLRDLQVEAEKKALEVTPAKPADKDNAALVYLKAFALLPEDDQWEEHLNRWWEGLDETPPRLDVSDPELKKFFQQQAPTLSLLHEAAELPACQFPTTSAIPDVDELMEVVYPMREAAELLQLHAHVSAATGDMQAAMRDVQTTYRLAEHERSHLLLVSLLVSYAIDSMAQATLQQLLSDREPTLEELSPLKFETGYSRTRFLARTFRMEEAFGLHSFSRLQSDKSYQIALARMMGLPGKSHGILHRSLLSFYRIFMMEEDMKVYRVSVGKITRLTSLPYQQASQASEDMRISMEQNHDGIMAQMIIPALGATFNNSASAAAWHLTAETAVAVHRFRAEEGKLPQTLQELVPKYLPAVPLDPFDEQPLRWKITDDDWVVYSIGENLQDDGGEPLYFKGYPPSGDICFFSRLPEAEPAAEEAAAD